MTDYYAILKTNDLTGPACFTNYLGKHVEDFSVTLEDKERSGCSLLAVVREEELEQ